MQLKILLPANIYADKTDVLRIVVESQHGSFGILPHRLDCVASLVPGILIYETATDGEVFVAVDEGLLVKNGDQVSVSVRRAIGGVPLNELRALVKSEFQSMDEQEKELHQVLSRLETGFVKQFSDLSQA